MKTNFSSSELTVELASNLLNALPREETSLSMHREDMADLVMRLAQLH